jgi:hypothetical protein
LDQVYFDETGTSQEYTLPQDAADVRSYTFRKIRWVDPIDAVSPYFVPHARVLVCVEQPWMDWCQPSCRLGFTVGWA